METPGQDADRITIEIIPIGAGYEVTITREMSAEHAAILDRTAQG